MTFFRILGVSALIVAGLCFVVRGADAAVLTSNELVPGAYGEITGEGFGELSDKSFLCFNVNSKCFDKSSFATVKGFEWSANKIIFGVPGDIPLSGSIIVYNSGKRSQCNGSGCTVQDGVLEIARLSYLIRPVIRSVDPLVWNRDQQIAIKGAGFGEAIGTVLFDDLSASVVKWSDKEIFVRAASDGIVKRIQVQSPNGARTAFELFSYLDHIQAPAAWSLAGDAPVVVAVIDDGLYVNHPQIKSYVWKNPKEVPGNNKDDDGNGYVDDVYGYNFMQNTGSVDPTGSHGTHVASITLTTAQSGMSGTKSNVRIMPLVVADAQGVISSRETISKAIKYATDNGASVINASFGSGGTTGYAKEYDEAVQYAFDRGAIVVAAAGNDDRLSKDGTDLNVVPQSPVCNNNGRLLLLGVAALDNADGASGGKRRARWSSYGSNCVQLAAPGVNIPGSIPPQYSSDKSSSYEQGSGTSFSAPIVSGVVAMMKATFPAMPNWEIMNRVIASADDIEKENGGYGGSIGGRINALHALSAMNGQPSIDDILPTKTEPGKKIVAVIPQFSSQLQVRLINENTAIPIDPSHIRSLAADMFEMEIPQDVSDGSYSLSVSSSGFTAASSKKVSIQRTAENQQPTQQSSVAASISPAIEMPRAISVPVGSSWLDNERALTRSIDEKLTARLKGRILLQIQEQGQAWYVSVKDGKRYYMSDGQAAFGILRRFGTGIRTADLAAVPMEGMKTAKKNALTERLKGKILIDVEHHGEAWYVNPVNGLRYYLKNGEEAYRIMRQLGLGISNALIRTIRVGE